VFDACHLDLQICLVLVIWFLIFVCNLLFGSWNSESMIRVVLPHHLRTLARVGAEVELEVGSQVTLQSVLDALEARYPMLRGTIRDHTTQQRRPFLRYFACEQDLSNEPADTKLPDLVVAGKEPLIVLGAIAGG
jgi:molybdopterin synthase sulfur carrier subunit